MGCSFWTAIFCERKRSTVSSNFLHEVLTTLSVTSNSTAILDALVVAALSGAIYFSVIRQYFAIYRKYILRLVL